MLECRVVEVVVMSGPVADMTIKATMQWRILFLIMAEMPFSHAVVRVAQIFEILRQNLFGQWQSTRLGRIQNGVLHARMNGIFARHQCRSGWRTNRRHIISIQY